MRSGAREGAVDVWLNISHDLMCLWSWWKQVVGCIVGREGGVATSSCGALCGVVCSVCCGEERFGRQYRCGSNSCRGCRWC